jgi:Tfp pilus assembly protein PilN
MYTIDLLKGQGIPIKHRRGGSLFLFVTFVVPLIAVSLLYFNYVMNRTTILIDQSKIEILDKNIAKLKPALEAKALVEAQCADMRVCLGDTTKVVGRNQQWSDVLLTMVEEMPPAMLLSKLDVRVNATTKQVPDRSDPNKLRTAAQTQRTLQISLMGDRRVDNIESVRSFIESLREAPVFAQRVDDIRLVGQEVDKLRDREMMRYDIDCVFKAHME